MVDLKLIIYFQKEIFPFAPFLPQCEKIDNDTTIDYDNLYIPVRE